MATRDTIDAEASRLVGRYELLAPVVSGALGELWQARIASGPEEGRVVDIRRVSRSVGLEKRDIERLTNAGFAAMELRNPRIAAVLDVVVGAAEIAVVSEHIAGAVLRRMLSPRPGNRVPVPSGVAARIALDLLEAIDVLREPWAEIFPSDSAEDALLRTSLHGGLSPDGVLVASYGEGILLEAGLAGVALTVPAILARPDVIAYRAPEQLEPGRAIDERADVFGVGILLWEMITGRTLFGPAVLPRAPAVGASAKMRADPIAVSGARRRVLSHPIARLDALPPLKGKVHKQLADWVARCLERDPTRRFANVREAIDSLSALGEPAVSPHEGVVTFVESLGLTEPVLPARPGTEGAHDDVTADFGETAQAHAARMLDSIPPSTDVESLPPSEPTPRQEIVVPGAVRIGTVPHAEAVTVPPLMALEANRLELVGPKGSFPPVNAATAGERAQAASAATVLAASDAERRDDDTSATVVQSGASLASSGADDPELSARRARSKKVVLGVLAVAVLLVILALLRTAFVDAPNGAPAQAAAPTTGAVAGEAPRSPSVPGAPPAPSDDNSAQASAAGPTSVPGVAPGNPPTNLPANLPPNTGEKPARKAASAKKQAWRPSGI
jgi:serine/threonine-protein kinase